MSQSTTTKVDDAGTGSVKAYVAGFLYSLAITIEAYLLVTQHVFSDGWTVAAIVCLALVQLFVQLIFFLHLGRQSKLRWNLMVLSFAAIVVLIVVLGSLWIMTNLDHHHLYTTPQQINGYLRSQDGL